MNILFIGKLPPIQGGVSTSSMWSVLDICEAGHSVYYLTNSTISDSNYTAFDIPGEKPFFAHPNLKVIEMEEIPSNSYRPWANPFYSLFMGCAHRLISEHQIDCIIGWYYEPYGSVAATIGKLYNIPSVLRHAGSDLGLLMNFPNLRSSYTWAAKNATFVLANGSSADFFREIGVFEEKIVPVVARRLNDIYRFNSRKKSSHSWYTHELEYFVEKFHDWLEPQKFVSPQIANTINQGVINPKSFKMLMYGKVGMKKGSFQILESLDELAISGQDFQFFYALSGHQKQINAFCKELHKRTFLREKVFLLPPLMPWHIPDLLNQVNLTMFLEHDFPIDIHAPRVPREILASKSHLLCTREIVDKLPFGQNLVDGQNISIIDDPSNSGDLLRTIESLVASPLRCEAMATHACYLSDFIENEYSSKDVLIEVLEKIG